MALTGGSHLRSHSHPPAWGAHIAQEARAHLEADGSAVGLPEAGENLAQSARGTVLGKETGLVPGSQEEPACGVPGALR